MQIKLFTIPIGDSGSAQEEKKNCTRVILCYIGYEQIDNLSRLVVIKTMEPCHMSQFIVETRIAKGRLELRNVPFPDDTEVKVFVIPKFDLSRASFHAAQKLTRGIKGNLSDSIRRDRNER